MLLSKLDSQRPLPHPASGFYEWTGGKGDKQPHLFTASNGSPVITFAGLWENWRDPENGEILQSCTMIVAEPSAWMQEHHDRMPILLQPDEFAPWFDGRLGSKDMRTAAKGALREWPVSKRVNRTGEGDDDPSIIAKSA